MSAFEVDDVAGSKSCNKCGQVKPLTQYSRAASTRDGRRGECKACAREISDQWRQANQARWWRTYRQRMYGISWERYQMMLSAQEGVCAICRRPEVIKANNRRTTRPLCVDHDHQCCPGKSSCGKCIRGLICSRCNRGLGAFRDDRRVIAAALTYLDKTA